MKFLKGLLSLVLLVVILGGAAVGGGWLWMQNELAKAGPLEEDVTFTVEPGP